MPSISLTVQPTSGPAPLIVNVIATVTEPFQGYVILDILDVTYANPHRNEPGRLFGQEVNIFDSSSVDIQFSGISAGTSGRTYKFYGFLELETLQYAAESDPITVTVS